MHFLHGGVEYHLDDAWWIEAGMVGFAPSRASFRAGPSEFLTLHLFEVPVDDVEPLRRQGSHGIFNDSADSGDARTRVVRILRGFVADSAIPPIQVAKRPAGSACPFELIHGAHRFYCAVAAGFSHVPAVEVDHVWGSVER